MLALSGSGFSKDEILDIVNLFSVWPFVRDMRMEFITPSRADHVYNLILLIVGIIRSENVRVMQQIEERHGK